MRLLLLFSAAIPVAQQDTVTLTLNEAVDRAVAESPLVLAAEGAVAAPRGARTENLWPFPENPRLEYARTRRKGDGTTFDREWSVTQEIEIAGQNFVRRSAAGKRLRAAEARIADARRTSARAARRSYVTLALAERRAVLTDSAATFADRLAVIARKQLDAGEINRLVYNTAVLEAARQRSVADRARAEQAAAAADLARVLALEEGRTPRTTDLPELPRLRLDMTTVLATARARRPDLVAASLEFRAADQTVTAARLGFVPDLELGGIVGEEAGAEDLLGFSIGFSVPLFHRGQSEVGVARAEAAAARGDLLDTERRVLAEVRAAIERFERAAAAERRFVDEALQAATENVSLSDRAFAEGKLDITDVVVLRTTAVAAQLEYLAVRDDAYTAWFELAAALGVTPRALTDLAGVSP